MLQYVYLYIGQFEGVGWELFGVGVIKVICCLDV